MQEFINFRDTPITPAQDQVVKYMSKETFDAAKMNRRHIVVKFYQVLKTMLGQHGASPGQCHLAGARLGDCVLRALSLCDWLAPRFCANFGPKGVCQA